MEDSVKDMEVCDRISNEATDLTELLIKRMEDGQENIFCWLKLFRDAVEQMADQLIVASSEDARFSTFCRRLEHLEQNKRELDRCFSAFLGLEVIVTEGKMKLLQWEGDVTLLANRNSSAGGCVSCLREKSQLISEKFLEYQECRQRLEKVMRSVLPRFFEELYRLSDVEHGGRGFRMQSVCALCGFVCNEIKLS